MTIEEAQDYKPGDELDTTDHLRDWEYRQACQEIQI